MQYRIKISKNKQSYKANQRLELQYKMNEIGNLTNRSSGVLRR